jgi:transcriptional regulator
MYNPKSFAVLDSVLVKKIIVENSFGTLISGVPNELNVNHFPFLLEESEGDFVLWTHLARSNPQWKNIDGEVGNVKNIMWL